MVEPTALRFQVLDYFSGSKSIKGVGYYIATYAFTDAKCMVAFSGLHTLIADIEDFYADGARDDSLVKVTNCRGRIINPGMDADGKQVTVSQRSPTACASTGWARVAE